MSAAPDDAPSRFGRRLGLRDAVVLGLGSMLGAGVFVAIAPAAEAAGAALVVGIAIAGVVAYCNATSSAELAARHPEAGGTYAYGRRCLGAGWGALAGWAFLAGKTASCAAIALTFGAYVAPGAERAVAVAAAIALVAVNLAGVTKTAAATRVVVALVLAVLVAVVAVALGGDPAGGAIDPREGDTSPRALLEAAGIMFFAFAGYARIATLGEEVRDPRRVIPRAIPVALLIALAVYGVVAAAALAVAGPAAIAASSAPLETAVRAAGADGMVPVVTAGAALATAAVLLSLLAGVGRTVFAMSARGDLPRPLAAVDTARGVPRRAEVAVGLVVTALVLSVDLRDAIAFSAVTVLGYYAIANAASLTVPRAERRWPRVVPALGLVGCLALAGSLERTALIAGVVVLALAALAATLRHGPRGWWGPVPVD